MQPDQTVQHSRKPWLAGLLAFLCPGLGHLYAGRPTLALLLGWMPRTLFLLVFANTLGRDALALPLLLALVTLLLLLEVGQVAWAVWAASRFRTGYTLRRYNHLAVYLGFVVLFGLVGKGLSRYTRASALEAFKVPSATMLPSILVGDHVLTAKLGARKQSPRRGDVVVFRAPSRGGTNYIKRVVGVGGDEVSIVAGALQLNGRPVPRRPMGVQTHHEPLGESPSLPFQLVVFEETLDGARYLTGESPDATSSRDSAPVRVPDGSFFLLGDHRDNSLGSRSFGTVPAASVVGRVHSVFYSYGPEGVRWSRLALRL